MYRIEISPGEETVLRTIEELATAIKNGLVTTRSRIYHNATQKWLPIEFHPHYKKALATPDHRPRPIPAAPAAALQLPTPVSPPEPARPPTPVPVAAPVPGRPAAPTRNAGFLLPAVVASLPLIEVELPELTYPEAPVSAPVAPARASHASPTVPLPVARRRTTGSRPLLYAGAAVTLVVVGYLATTVAPSGQVAAEPAPALAEVPAPQPEPEPPPPEEVELAPASIPEPTPASASVPSPAPSPDPPPAAVSTPAPAPALAPALTTAGARAGPPSQAWSSSAGATTPLPVPPPAPVSAASAPAITPAPAALDLTVPSLPVADSMPPVRSTRDTGAIGRILKAVGATKPSEVKPAQ